MELVYVLLAMAAGVVAFLVVQYNKLVQMRQLVRNAWSDVDVYLKRRADLLPNLVEAVRGYAAHEQDTFVRTIEARNSARSAGSLHERAEAEAQIGQGVGKALLIAEAYPDLKASQSFIELQRELGETEKLIARARQYYNACVRDLNTRIETFPSNLVANLGGFKPVEFFQVEEPGERAAPNVQGLP
jgi:LemA protein